MKNRLSKILAASGIASRRACECLIFSGKVAINGEVVLLPQTLVDSEKDRITVRGRKITIQESKVYFLLNKPAGYVCTTVEKKMGAKRVLDFFSHLPYRLFTAGRLDQNTSGLIFVTNDGLFANRAIHPSFNRTKEYLAKTEQEITCEHLKKISQGVYLEKAFIKPVSVFKVRRGTLKIVVNEGKKHEVRALLANAQLSVRELIRIRIGPVSLGNLLPGEYRSLSEQELQFFLKS
jgi:23S rRNA pseudouridine2605 synthase